MAWHRSPEMEPVPKRLADVQKVGTMTPRVREGMIAMVLMQGPIKTLERVPITQVLTSAVDKKDRDGES